jgi:trehalose-6-phosphatase
MLWLEAEPRLNFIFAAGDDQADEALFERLQPSESLVLLTAAVLVGLLSGVGVRLFKALIQLINIS